MFGAAVAYRTEHDTHNSILLHTRVLLSSLTRN